MKFLVIYGSYRQTRVGIRAATYVHQQLEARGHQSTLIDAQAVALPTLDRMYKEFPAGTAPANMETLAGQIREADGFVVVTGEYNHLPPPGLLNLLDHYLEQWFWRPSAIVSYSQGQFGGVRAAAHLRDALAELGMPAIPSAFSIPRVQKAFDEKAVPAEESTQKFAKRFLDEFEWFAKALAHQRESGVPY